ncbi:zf-TFIIB domain-containing protein [Lysobacter auxotrophicus]|uniref:Zf-TFIIB domain-containing protein n=1 Tax=Lysobacter auxotrophicus TaxID=2992573 RepID=A0ABN6UM48_9GAMM|nr:zf-TFIIB domain-containing protein [Lysobacter auxotrophicus]BDU17432.1 zf-TFIIB domain-containing protein [Lysobacter auxotrophicus]
MDCPVCRDVKLAMTDRQGIEIDYCPQCRGVWLDRGELDKLIERASADVAPQPTRAAPPPPPSAHDPRGHDRDDRYKGEYKSDYKYRKKKNLLGELFDF